MIIQIVMKYFDNFNSLCKKISIIGNNITLKIVDILMTA